MSEKEKTIGILGGTGGLGTGLARRFVQAGFDVIIGSREASKASLAADELRALMVDRGVQSISVRAMDNVETAKSSDILITTVPFSQQRNALESIKPQLIGKILIDTTVPLVAPKVARVQMPKEGSAGLIAQDILGDEVNVVSAFQNVAAYHLQEGAPVECDILVCGNNKDARTTVISLINEIGMKGIHAGPLANSVATEALTSLLIFINKRNKCHAGIRISGLGDEE